MRETPGPGLSRKATKERTVPMVNVRLTLLVVSLAGVAAFLAELPWGG